MTLHNTSLIALASALFTFGANQARAEHWVADLNYANIMDTRGAEVSIGRDFRNSRFRLTPQLGLLVYQGKNDRYYVDTFSNGTERCRDSHNGQLADDSYCNNSKVKAYGKLEAAVTLGQSWEVGAGFRFSDDTTPYGVVSKTFNNNGLIKAFAGEDYYGVGVGIRF